MAIAGPLHSKGRDTMVYQGNGTFKFDPAEKAEIFEMALGIPSDPNGPPDLDAFEVLITHLEQKINREVDYHVRMRGGHK